MDTPGSFPKVVSYASRRFDDPKYERESLYVEARRP